MHNKLRINYKWWCHQNNVKRCAHYQTTVTEKFILIAGKLQILGPKNPWGVHLTPLPPLGRSRVKRQRFVFWWQHYSQRTPEVFFLMEILQKELHKVAQHWNTHTIRPSTVWSARRFVLSATNNRDSWLCYFSNSWWQWNGWRGIICASAS